jgi:hypothetical protein
VIDLLRRLSSGLVCWGMSSAHRTTRTQFLLDRRRFLGAGLSAGLGAALLWGGRARAAYIAAKVTSPGTISGAVRFSGKAAPPAPLSLSGDCEWCRQFVPRSEELLVSAQGGLRNVAVALEGIASGKEVPEEGAAISEIHCTFVPHVLTITAGAKLLLHNQDPVLNTFHAVSVSSGRTLFNIAMPIKGQKMQRRVREPGLVKMLCDVHPWELAWILSLDHPYHTVTDEKGAFVLEGVPPGRYTLALWHEKLGRRTQPVEVTPSAKVKVAVTYP